MIKFLLQFFTWWNGQTLGTRFYTWRKGERVGDDEFGNIYYQDPKTDRRWVIYNGVAEASAVPPSWHGWLHHSADVPPTKSGYKPRPWEKAPMVNPTGTPGAYRPKGSILSSARRPKATGDYDAWQPE